MSLCACGNDETVSEMASDAISDVATDASEMLSPDNGTVSDGDGMIGNETTSTEESNNEQGDDSTNNTNNNDDNSANGESATDIRDDGMM